MKSIDKVKKFAGKQFLEGLSDVSFYYKGTEIVNPWYDETGRFELNDEQAAVKYGEENIKKFCLEVEAYLSRQYNTMAIDK